MSRCLCNVSSPFLFDTFTIRITTKSISTLEAVSNHPIFGKPISTIKLCLCFYGDVEDQLMKIGLISECDRRFHSIWLTIIRVFNATQRTVDESEQFKRIQSRIGAALSKFRRPLSFEMFGYIRTGNEINPRSCSIATTLEWLDSDENCLDIVLNVMASRGQSLTVGIERRFARTFKGIFDQLSRHRLTVDLDAPKPLQLFRPKKAERDTISSVVQRAEHLSFAARWWSKHNLNFGILVSTDEPHEEMHNLASFTKAFFNTESVRSVEPNIHDYSLHVDPPYISAP
ncbi:hypothetical protein AJ78_04752 [Emergomyces pasteurianus Ep9510]|uniref:Uncharacterized protein n=1 Tax=Emergomyces pasteurianus Ep9510 TaxID=1447872 RepID=A0A1J9PEL2_9EURO|nr:hypothetical protein AJ78_04752 [Emergomyces pasteurianus Ep9510]